MKYEVTKKIIDKNSIDVTPSMIFKNILELQIEAYLVDVLCNTVLIIYSHDLIAILR